VEDFAMSDWSIRVIEYAQCLKQPVGTAFYGAFNEGTMPFSYSYVYLRGQGHHVFVDVGYDDGDYGGTLAHQYDVTDWRDADQVCAEVGITPSDVDTVILTHAHYDHMGNLHNFPNAHVYLQRKEVESWQEMMELGPKFQALLAAVDPADIMYAVELAQEGRLTLVDGDLDDVLPGIHLRSAFDTHTKGSQYVVVETGKQLWVMTGDNMFSYQNAEGRGDGAYVPIGFGTASAIASLQIIDEMVGVAGDTNRLVIVHDKETFQRFKSWTGADHLSIAELSIAPFDKSEEQA